MRKLKIREVVIPSKTAGKLEEPEFKFKQSGSGISAFMQHARMPFLKESVISLFYFYLPNLKIMTSLY